EGAALRAYEKVLGIPPVSAELANNTAWLLLTAKDSDLRDSGRALDLAGFAAWHSEQGYILDTLATALWAVGRKEEALELEKKAAALDPKNRAYYQAQKEKFQEETWQGNK
ncbi:MAG: peptidase M48 Ste24p, partial [Candidatus Electrothrix sp. EH2]|nr:peptidase M48 Ste24p [Candidatus Electrothrix sp. EH2]